MLTKVFVRRLTGLAVRDSPCNPLLECGSGVGETSQPSVIPILQEGLLNWFALKYIWYGKVLG